MSTPYVNILACALHMDQSGGMRFRTEAAAIDAVNAAAAHFGKFTMESVEGEIKAFAEEHAFAHTWLGQGQDDEGNEPPTSSLVNDVLEAIYIA